jgi:DNA primase small subunit
MTVTTDQQQDMTKSPVTALMPSYYSWLFPHEVVYQWLAYGNESKHPQADSTFFQRREFCFTLDGDVFVRYQSFKNGQELKSAILKRVPSKIDIGPVYNVDPQKRAAYANQGGGFAPQERELVFDIDLTDYDDVRTCGKEAHICSKCWPLMAVAIDILNRALREDFGFKHIFFVFSGRRGVHAWVCDERARSLSDDARSAIANYLSVYKGQEKGLAKLSTGLESHPFVSSAYEALSGAFESKLLAEQGLLEDEVQTKTIMSMLSQSVQDTVSAEWRRIDKELEKQKSEELSEQVDGTSPGKSLSLLRWEAIKSCTKKECAKLGKSKDSNRSIKLMEKAVKDIVFAFSYPRLDIEVSKKMNHLLKAPFCVHPKTGKVCVPIHPKHAWEFDPDSVCTVGKLLNELNRGEKKGEGSGDGAHHESYMTTEMGLAVQTFRECFLDSLLKENKNSLTEKARIAAERQGEQMAW